MLEHPKPFPLCPTRVGDNAKYCSFCCYFVKIGKFCKKHECLCRNAKCDMLSEYMKQIGAK